jgi:hypothetical protein
MLFEGNATLITDYFITFSHYSFIPLASPCNRIPFASLTPRLLPTASICRQILAGAGFRHDTKIVLGQGTTKTFHFNQ